MSASVPQPASTARGRKRGGGKGTGGGRKGGGAGKTAVARVTRRQQREALQAEAALEAATFPPPARPARNWRMLRTLAALVLREMSTSYGRSPGGYLWAVLEPVAAIGLLTIIFSMMLRAPSLGSSFPLFYASGYLFFTLFTEVSSKSASSIRFSRPLLKYPAVTFVDAILARVLLTVLTSLIVGAMLFGGILMLFDTHTLLDLPKVIQAVGLATVLGMGVGVLNCYLITAFPIWETGWSVLTRPLFVVSGIFYIYEDVPAMARDILWWNPLIHVTGIARTGFYSTYSADYASPLYVLVCGLVPMCLGLLLLYRFHRDLMQN
jgi:capsular polysaccharide transport system permease protein